jgi:DNA mismatch repair protein MutS2
MKIGTGTDPSEGAAIGQAVIEELLRFKSKVIVTTHYGELKTLAYNHQGISNASVEFDSETLSPTYRLLIGVPGKSNALHIAKKYGIKKEIIARAGELLKGEEFDLSSSIENLEKEYVIISEERKKAEKLSKELEEKQKLFEQKFDELEVKKKKIQDKIQDEFETEIESALEEIKKVVRELQQDKSSQNAEIARQLVDEISSKTKSKYITKPVKEHIIIPEIKPGEYYYLERLRDIVQVISKKDNKVEVQAGLLKLSVDIMDLKKIENKDLKQKVRNLKGVKGSTVVKNPTQKRRGI